MSDKRIAKVFLEIEVEVNKDKPNDASLTYSEIAEYAAGGIVVGVKSSLDKSGRPSELVSARYEFTVKKQCLN